MDQHRPIPDTQPRREPLLYGTINSKDPKMVRREATVRTEPDTQQQAARGDGERGFLPGAATAAAAAEEEVDPQDDSSFLEEQQEQQEAEQAATVQEQPDCQGQKPREEGAEGGRRPIRGEGAIVTGSETAAG